jgi:hypothetical protein
MTSTTSAFGIFPDCDASISATMFEPRPEIKIASRYFLAGADM